MLRSMTAQQWREWQVFADLEPFDPERDDQRIGWVTQALVNIYRPKGHTARTLKQCTPTFGDFSWPKLRRSSAEAMQELAKAMTEESRRAARRADQSKRRRDEAKGKKKGKGKGTR